ncbi:MAG TPA: S41 family peptidase [Sediminibacterium sp.]|nr:S41 family peptidase [Sediminibacterium sp.]
MKPIKLPIRWYRKIIAPFVLILWCAQTIMAQQKLPIVITEPVKADVQDIEVYQIKQDFAFFREILQKEHPGLYRYKSKAEMDKLFDSCFAALNHPMKQLMFAKSITFLISAIEDGHTASNVPRLLMNQYAENEKLFPARLFFIDYKAYVLCSRIQALPAEAEIVSIDDKPIAEIKKLLFQYLPSDGKIETKKIQTLNNGAFPFLYKWIFGNKNSFVVRYRTKQGGIRTVGINAAFAKDIECDNEGGSDNKKDLQLDFPKSNTALLTIKTFDDNRLAGEQYFRDFLDTSFKKINSEQIATLIVDLRGNAGGRDEYGALLYAYLTNKPFKYFSAIESGAGKIREKDNPLLGLQQPEINSFGGKALFLVNGLCFSTTADFCSIAKSNNRGLFIGEETGGAYYGNTSGQIKTVVLPNSGIIVKIPQFKYENAVKKAKYPDRGTLPDYTIMPTINDVKQRRDIQLYFALELAGSLYIDTIKILKYMP